MSPSSPKRAAIHSQLQDCNGISRTLNAGAQLAANTSPGFSRNGLENLTSKEHCSERVEAIHQSIETPFKMKNVRQDEIRALKDNLI